MVVIDATMLLLLLSPGAGVPLDDATGQPVTNFQNRLAYWVETTEKAGDKIVIPAPALSEALVRAGAAGPQIVAEINKQSVFQIWPFDVIEAMELAILTRADIDKGKKRGDDPGAIMAKIKYDRQIVAIAKVSQSTTIYTDDKGIRGFATRAGLAVVRLAELPERPLPPEQELPFEQGLSEASGGPAANGASDAEEEGSAKEP
ncbi:MAG: hypothetical protein HXY28_06400 [Hydrogenophilaceae bacterium]|jgi:hypothetical protein|nr:hypothetical protein [Hydrogenophilaceae bacterium]